MPKTTWNCVMTDNEARHLDSLCRQVEVTDEDIRGYVNLLINQAYELGRKCQGQPNTEQYITILGKDAQAH